MFSRVWDQFLCLSIAYNSSCCSFTSSIILYIFRLKFLPIWWVYNCIYFGLEFALPWLLMRWRIFSHVYQLSVFPLLWNCPDYCLYFPVGCLFLNDFLLILYVPPVCMCYKYLPPTTVAYLFTFFLWKHLNLKLIS